MPTSADTHRFRPLRSLFFGGGPILCAFGFTLGCQASAPMPKSAATAPAPDARRGDAVTPSAAPGEPAPGDAPGHTLAPSGSEPAPGGMPPTPPDPSRALPEIRVINAGLHIGGGPNDDASREPFKRAIEPHFEQFLICYREAEDPLKGGTFGVDFFIRREGGRADVRQPRTGIRGETFRECMLEAFSAVEFERPAKGPTVISYSVRFRVEEGEGR